MKAVSRVHITPHMHWDREWYFTTEESRILLVNNMEEILCRLEQDNEYKYYVLDGQTAILEDYFAVKPENKDRVKKQVEAGKLIIGPWYTQTDTTIVSAESIVRNLMYGMRDCLAFGEPVEILIGSDNARFAQRFENDSIPGLPRNILCPEQLPRHPYHHVNGIV